jgi:hypothetical protein
MLFGDAMAEGAVQEGGDPTTRHKELTYLGGEIECQVPSQCLHGIFGHDHLNNNYKRLDQYYQKKLTPDDIDDRVFLNKNIKNLTPFKVSPYARSSQLPRQTANFMAAKQAPNDELEPPQKRQLQSGRMLNYDQHSYESITLR